MVFASRALNDSRLWRAFALIVALSLFTIGCGGGGSSGGGGVPPPVADPEGNTPGTAVVITPDGASFAGAINFGGDVDWFTFRAGAGITYTLQIFGFPPDPFLLPENDLTGDGDTALRAKIVSFDGVAQILNSTGTAGGEEYNVNPALGSDVGSGFVVIGDTRIAWVSPTTNDYFIRIRHGATLTGRGHYVLHLASSQRGITDTGRTQTGIRFLDIQDDMGEDLFVGLAAGLIGFPFWELPDLEINIDFGVTLVTFIGDEDPQTPAVHLHVGIPNMLDPHFSANFQACEDPHCFVFAFDIIVGRRGETETYVGQTEFVLPAGTLPTANGDPVRVPVTYEVERFTNDEGADELHVSGTMHFGDALGSNRGTVTDLGADILRTVIGFSWYADVHVTDDFDAEPLPVAVSLPHGDIYSLFESELAMSESNVVVRDGNLSEALRGLNPDFTLFYDSSLKALQIARRTYDALFASGLVSADAESYTGDLLSVFARGSGGADAIIQGITIPGPENPDVFQVDPGFRNVIKQLSNAEAEDLRDAYYSTGIYFEVRDSITGEPIARADVAPLTPGVRSLDIQDVAFPQIISPFRSSDEPLRKGVINFASDYAKGGQITVVANGQVLGVLNDYLEEGQAPKCGETHTTQSLAAEYWPHRYPYKAIAEDGTEWEGHFEIQSGACETIVLSVD